MRLTSFKPNELGKVERRQHRLPLLVLPSGDNKSNELQAERNKKVRDKEVRGKTGDRFVRSPLKAVYLLITIMVLAASHPHLAAVQVTSQATPAAEAVQSPGSLPDDPGATRYPQAEVLPSTDDSTAVEMESDTQSKLGSRYLLDGDVVITYRDRVIKADHIEYDTETGELTANGHLRASGGPNHEDIQASHGTMNLNRQTGTFYDVTGSVGVKNTGRTMTYSSSNPFLFTGRMVVRTGPEEYEIYDGTLTSCQLPNPDWMLSSDKFTVNMTSKEARAQKSTFRLMNVPLLYLPYVTHPVDSGGRQSGFLIPTPGYSSTKGIILGDEYYWAINRSTDLTVGLEYFSLRGWSQSATFRYRGLGNDFARAHYTGLQDRGIVINGVYENQGGEDVVFSGRHDFSTSTRVAADSEYLSSFTYRQAFAQSFSQAVSSDILSIVYGVHEANGYDADARYDRYQGLKSAAMPGTPTTPAIPEQEIHIFHAPAVDFTSTEHEIGQTGLQWSLGSSFAGLSRVQPSFSTGGLTARLDLHPEIAFPMSFDGWRVRASAGARETAYSRSRKTPYTGLPVELPTALSRADVEAGVDVRPPVLERTFDSDKLEKAIGYDVKHTIEPEITYRYVAGIDNFLNVLRFDDVDVASDTNELEYGVTQRLFVRPVKARPCVEKAARGEQREDVDMDLDQGQVEVKERGGDLKARAPVCGSRELISWRLAQKYFFDETFGGAVLEGRRNIFDTTLNFSGIAFLTEPRAISPLISRLRVRTSEHMDLEWDFDLDTGAKKFTSNNVMLNVHEGNIFGGLSYARLNAPGRFYTEGVASSVSNFNQLRLLLGYGSPTKAGLGVAANVGLDLNAGDSGLVQYGALQTSYNWDCCGFSVEVRKYELGSVRNETVERFNFTLLNIGTAGNLRRAASLF